MFVLWAGGSLALHQSISCSVEELEICNIKIKRKKQRGEGKIGKEKSMKN